MKKLKLEVGQSHLDKTLKYTFENGVAMVTPPIDEAYWLYRVQVSKKQAIVGFKKFGTVGIGFQHEIDWNTNLPYSCDAEEIYEHIKINRNGAIKEICIKAINMIKDAHEAYKNNAERNTQ